MTEEALKALMGEIDLAFANLCKAKRAIFELEDKLDWARDSQVMSKWDRDLIQTKLTAALRNLELAEIDVRRVEVLAGVLRVG